MSTGAAFWDASALTPLCVREQSSNEAIVKLAKFPPVVWWATTVEIHSAIARLERAGDLDRSEKGFAMARLLAIRKSWQEILPSDDLRELAQKLLYRYTLRAADSLQLAAAMTWCGRRIDGRVFVASDARLCEAAAEAGFEVLRLGFVPGGR